MEFFHEVPRVVGLNPASTSDNLMYKRFGPTNTLCFLGAGGLWYGGHLHVDGGGHFGPWLRAGFTGYARHFCLGCFPIRAVRVSAVFTVSPTTWACRVRAVSSQGCAQTLSKLGCCKCVDDRIHTRVCVRETVSEEEQDRLLHDVRRIIVATGHLTQT